MNADLIALDWGTSSLRAYAIAADGSVIGTRNEALGIMQVQNCDFYAALRQCCGDWLDASPRARLIASGMIGSKQGWKEAPYCPCPANAAAITKAMVSIDIPGARTLHIVPGVSCIGAVSGVAAVPGVPGWSDLHGVPGVPDVMRGEETQIFGALPATGNHVAVLPGTHSKWVWVDHGSITGFSSWMTGEVYAALTQHTILGRLMQLDAPHDDAAFARGVRYGFDDPASLLQRLFSARTLGLFTQLEGAALPSYLSGVLIGTEIGGALARLSHTPPEITLLGSALLVQRYAAALALCGYNALPGAEDAARIGLTAFAAKLV